MNGDIKKFMSMTIRREKRNGEEKNNKTLKAIISGALRMENNGNTLHAMLYFCCTLRLKTIFFFHCCFIFRMQGKRATFYLNRKLLGVILCLAILCEFSFITKFIHWCGLKKILKKSETV